MKTLVAWLALTAIVVINFKFCYGANAAPPDDANQVSASGVVASLHPACSPHDKKCSTSARGALATAFPRPPYKIAVIDTGYRPDTAFTPAKLCDSGHFDYFTQTANLNWVHPHGTQVASIIAEKLHDVDYCLVIYQVARDASGAALATDIADAVNRAIGEGVVAINVSLTQKNHAGASEQQAFEFASKANIEVFFAAGNAGQDLDKNCDFYPTCYRLPHEVIVGGQDPMEPNHHAQSSNYGKVVQVWAPEWYDDGDTQAVGTSYAAPRALSEYILFLASHQHAPSSH